MEVAEALDLAWAIVGASSWELVAVRRLPASPPAPSALTSSPPSSSVRQSMWVVEACYHATALRWDEVFTLHSWAEWTFIRDAQPARLARRVALMQARRPYLPGAPGAAPAPLPTTATGAASALRGAPVAPERDADGDATPDRADLESLEERLDEDG